MYEDLPKAIVPDNPDVFRHKKNVSLLVYMAHNPGIWVEVLMSSKQAQSLAAALTSDVAVEET